MDPTFKFECVFSLTQQQSKHWLIVLALSLQSQHDKYHIQWIHYLRMLRGRCLLLNIMLGVFRCGHISSPSQLPNLPPADQHCPLEAIVKVNRKQELRTISPKGIPEQLAHPFPWWILSRSCASDPGARNRSSQYGDYSCTEVFQNYLLFAELFFAIFHSFTLLFSSQRLERRDCGKTHTHRLVNHERWKVCRDYTLGTLQRRKFEIHSIQSDSCQNIEKTDFFSWGDKKNGSLISFGRFPKSLRVGRTL